MIPAGLHMPTLADDRAVLYDNGAHGRIWPRMTKSACGQFNSPLNVTIFIHFRNHLF
jgi:hypothetical protein